MKRLLTAAASLIGLAAHASPLPTPRGQRTEQPLQLSEDESERLARAAEIVRNSRQTAMAEAELKRIRKAEKLQKIADKGGINRAVSVKGDEVGIAPASPEAFFEKKPRVRKAPSADTATEAAKKKSPKKTPAKLPDNKKPGKAPAKGKPPAKSPAKKAPKKK